MGIHQKKLLSLLEENQWDVFSLEMLVEEGTLERWEIHQALRYMTKNGMVNIIEKGKYRRMHFSDEHVIGCFIVQDGIVAYWSALNAYGLTEQFPNKLFIQNSQRSGIQKIPGIGSDFHFIKVKPEKIIGYKTRGYGNHVFRITDVEKTIVDCFDLPQYSGGYAETIKALNKAKPNARKMVRYCKAIDNIAVTKRLAYLIELLRKTNMDIFLAYAEKVMNQSYSPFAPSLPVSGPYYRKWKLVLNMPEEEILEMANPMY